MKTLRTSIFALLAVAAVYAESTSIPAGVNVAKDHNMSEWIQVRTEGATAVKDPADPQQALHVNVPAPADRKRPVVLKAPGGGGCRSCINPSPFSAWQQFQMAVSMLYWI